MREGIGSRLVNLEYFFAQFYFLCFIIHLTFICGGQTEYQFGCQDILKSKTMKNSLFHSRTFLYFHVDLFESRLVIG
jgi:hypothetical protein